MDDYDFVIVGGGTAGCVLAARLSENPEVSVLLLEAGAATPPPGADDPPKWPALSLSPANWGEVALGQTASGTPVPVARGRVLGGSSVINAMVFVRGHRSSYDRWPDEGATGWGFDDLLPYFRRTETATGRDPAVRGTDGPLVVGPAASPNPVFEDCLEAALETGYRRADDISGGLEEGFGWPDLNITAGRRQSVLDAYLAPAVRRPNLRVVPEALVHRVLVARGRCVGVEYTVGGGRPLRAGCGGEVVLTAGAIGSAQLLMLSGIGPGSSLRPHGIAVIAELPGVGENLQDHARAGVVYRPARPVPAGVNNHGEVLGLLRGGPGLDHPDMQVVFIDLPVPAPTMTGPESGYTIEAALMRPHSRGTVRLAGARPGVSPVLDPRYLSDPRDLDAMVAGLRTVREIGRARALAPWRAEEALPGPDVDDDAALRSYAERALRSFNHPVGTCRMGTGAMSVVDPELKVHGIGGLRVADASVMPSIVSANTNATVYAIAERAAVLLGA